MIYCLTGELIYASPLSGSVVIDCCGVGYALTVTANTIAALPAPKPDGSYSGDQVRVFTYMAVREDAVELFGFATPAELDCFKLLITVSGVGPKAAMSILSLFTPEKLALAISAEDVKSISRAPGVGAKTAARVVLELKEKMAKAYPAASAGDVFPAKSGAKPAASGDRSKLSDAQEALLVLGYSRQEVASVLKDADLSADVETIIRRALGALIKA
ncbi:MAG: Holliday junction branch migration protein RuvA [Clostridia bacterium]|nr:Holliday junction branch migration protein RuvA [Clostridia bacterium]